MKKLTAVEWLIEEYINGAVINIQIMKRALEMEKEQIMEAYWQGDAESDNINVDAEDYYNETFKSE